jgi:hypothetical protein
MQLCFLTAALFAGGGAVLLVLAGGCLNEAHTIVTNGGTWVNEHL